MNKDWRIKQCQTLLAENKTQREICQILKMSPKLVTSIRNGTYTEDSRSRGRPRVFTKEMTQFADEMWSVNALISDASMADLINAKFGTNVSRASVQRRRRELRYEYRPPKVRQLLTEEQRKIRVEFCRYILENREQFPCILFSDESRFANGPDNQWRRIKRGTYNDTCFAEKEKFTSGVIMWGAISCGYRTELIECSNHVNANEYIDVMKKSCFIEKMNETFGRGNWCYMHDGAPCHSSATTTAFLVDKKVIVLPGWPPNSPDLNPIEIVWGIIKRRIHGQCGSAADFVAKLTEVWRSIDKIVIDSLVQSFFDRCELLLRLDGESLTPYLQAHRTGPATVVDYRRNWTEEDDRTLMRLHEEHGAKWKRIADIMGERPIFVKYRYKRMRQIIANSHHLSFRPLPRITELEFPLLLVPGKRCCPPHSPRLI